MSYNSQEIKALVAPFWGLSMDDLQGAVVVGWTTSGKLVFIDSSVGNQGPGGPAVPTPTSSKEQATVVAMHLIAAVHDILGGCVLGAPDA